MGRASSPQDADEAVSQTEPEETFRFIFVSASLLTGLCECWQQTGLLRVSTTTTDGSKEVIGSRQDPK